MRLIVCDTEVFECDYIVVFYDITNNQWLIYHNDPVGIASILQQKDCIFVGFNVKHYDKFILQAISHHATPAILKEISNFIVLGGRPGWEHWYVKSLRGHRLQICDLADDTQVGTSLKSIEGHLGQNIKETEVDFNLKRPLTERELQKTIAYCRNDVIETAKLLITRKNYLQSKIDVGRLKGIPAAKALSLTNAKLTALFLGAKPVPRNDERNYVFPAALHLDMIPTAALNFFKQIWDYNIPKHILFEQKLHLTIGGCPTTIAWGGIHGAIKKCVRTATENYIIVNYDVASLYPSLMIYWNYISRNISKPEDFIRVYHDRLDAKSKGNKKLSNPLKLILNTAFGAMLNSNNDLFDPLMGRSVCITGQLFMLDLVCTYLKTCSTVEILQLNTDGVMIGIHPSDLPKIQAVNAEWETRSHLMLEEDRIERYVARDVNTYILRKTDGTIKKKGWLTSGIPPTGAFKINNDYPIVKKALSLYFIDNIPIRNTILGCQDIHQFQLIAKAGGNYNGVYLVPNEYDNQRNAFERKRKKDPSLSNWRWQDYSGPRIPVQRVNRVYATNAPTSYLIKVKPSGELGKISNLPSNLTIDNDNRLSIEQIDKEWYIREAIAKIPDFYGEEMFNYDFPPRTGNEPIYGRQERFGDC